MDIYFTLWDITQYNFIFFLSFFLAHFVPPLVIGSFLLWHVPLLFVGYFFLSYFLALTYFMLLQDTPGSHCIFFAPSTGISTFPREPWSFCWKMKYGLPWWLSNKESFCQAENQSLTQEDPLEKEMATHSSILAWEIPWTEEPGKVWSMEKQKNWTWLSD